jgi:S1-C subfamily serine protease
MRKMSRLSPRYLAAPLTAVLVAGAFALEGCGGSTKSPPVNTAPASAAATQTPATTTGIPKLVERVQPQVVTVLTGGGLGSGVIYRSDGIILTNEHVIRGHDSVQIAFADGRREAGKVIAGDVDTDLALVRVDRRGLPAATFQTALPPVGSQAIVLGSPLGFDKSVTAGIISGLHRSIPGSARESSALVDLMQTDAAISPGNSGGAVVNAEGRVIGISEAYIPPEQGAVAIGFAIPAATAVNVANQLLEKGHAQHAFIGLQPAQLTPQLAQELGLKQSSGVLVYDVGRGGPAEKAGIEPGDVLISAAGKRLTSVEDLFVALRDHRPGQTITLERVHDGNQETVDVLLSDKPQ